MQKYANIMRIALAILAFSAYAYALLSMAKVNTNSSVPHAPLHLREQRTTHRRCSPDGESGTTGAVFIVQNGATVKNVVIGSNQREVCEDSLTIDGSGTGSVTFKNIHILNGGKDKIIQHNGSASLTFQNIKIDSAPSFPDHAVREDAVVTKGARRVTAKGIPVGGSGQEVLGSDLEMQVEHMNQKIFWSPVYVPRGLLKLSGIKTLDGRAIRGQHG
ncbi:hypothetical protein BJ742DRAFT_739594 [Cladochytrium replicatum]|nr:hypothetical protein BJ742DRAFT_739594 [Cladochytrium replicatum]